MHTALLRSQKNYLYSLISEYGLAPRDFEWTVTDPLWLVHNPEPVEKLVHRPSGSYFVFDTSQHGHSASPRYSPHRERNAEKISYELTSWESVRIVFAEWLAVVKDELDEPDLWTLSKEDTKLVVASIDEVENAPFSRSEQQRIRTSISEIHEFLLRTRENSEADLKFIKARLDHLADASSRLGRKDWITLAMGTLTNIVVGCALAPDAARELIRAAGALLGWVVGGVQLLL